MKRYLELFFRHPLLFSLPMILALTAGVGYGSKGARTFSSAATLFCDASLPNASTLSQAVSPGGVTPSADKMSTLQEFLQTQSFVDKVAQRATHSQQIDELAANGMAKSITVATAGPQILTISVKSPSPTMAADTVRAVIDEFTAELGGVLQARAASLARVYKANLDATAAAVTNAQTPNELALAQQQHATALDQYNQALTSASAGIDPTAFHVVDTPRVPSAPASRKKQILMSGIGGLIGGVVITIIALVLLMAQDRSVREEEDVETSLDLEVAGTVPQFDKCALSTKGRRQKREPQGSFWTPPGLVEACTVALRHLEREVNPPAPFPRAGLLKVTKRAPIAERGPAPRTTRRIGVTSCLRGEGRSTIARGMAAAAYQAYGERAVLVELDFEAPSLARQLGIGPGPGVADILRDGASIAECLHMSEDGSVGAIVAGNTGGDLAGLLSSLRTSSLMRDLGGVSDIVIADLPPLSPVGQAASLAPLFSTVLLVVRTGAAPVNQIRRALDDLDKPPPVLLNGVESSIPRPLRSLLAG